MKSLACRWVPNVCLYLSLLTLPLEICHAVEDVLPINTELQLVVDAEGFTGTPVQALALDNTGTLLAAGADKVVRVWRRESARASEWTLFATLRGYQEAYGYEVGIIHSLCFSPDSRYLLVGVADNSLAGSTRVFDLQNEASFHAVMEGHLGCTKGIAFSSSGKTVATWSCDGQIVVSSWDAKQGTAELNFRVKQPTKSKFDFPDTFGFFDDDTLVFSEAGHGDVYSVRERGILDKESWPPALAAIHGDIPLMEYPPYTNAGCQFTDVQAAKNLSRETWRAFAGFNRPKGRAASYFAAVWTADNPNPILYKQHHFDIVSLTFNRKAGLAASADRLGEIHIWELGTGRKLTSLIASDRPIWRVAWGPEDTLLFSDKSYGHERYQYNRRGPINHGLNLQKMAIVDGTFPDDNPLSKFERGNLNLTLFYDETNGLQLFDESKTYELNPHLHGGTANFNRVPSSKAMSSIWTYGFFSYPEVSPSTPRFLLGTQAGELFECTYVRWGEHYQPKVARRFIGHTGAITSFAVSADGRKLATSSLDGTIRVWALTPPRTLADLAVRTIGSTCLACGIAKAKTDVPTVSLIKGDIITKFANVNYFERLKLLSSGEFKVDDKVVIERAKLISGPNGELEVKRENITEVLVEAPDLAEPILNVFFGADDEWVAWTQDGFYNASTEGAKHIGMHQNRERHKLADYFSVEQFENQLYDPDLVLKTLQDPANAPRRKAPFAIASLRPEQRLALKVAGNEERANETNSIGLVAGESVLIHPPTISILAPLDNATITGGSTKVRIEVRYPQGRRLGEVFLTMNNALTRTPQRVSEGVAPSGLIVEEFEVEVKLETGRHTLTAFAEHDKGKGESRKVRIDSRNGSVVTDSRLPNLYILAIGVSDYFNERLSLQFAHSDAYDIAAAFKRLEGVSFGQVQVKCIVNDDATRSGIEQGLNWLAKNCTRATDLAIVFGSGHGLHDVRDDWYFAPHDFDASDASLTGVSRLDFEKFLNRVPRAVLCLDTCRNSVLKAEEGVKGVGVRAANPFRGFQHPILFSCAPGNISREGRTWQHGAFSQGILDVLKDLSPVMGSDEKLQFSEFEEAVKSRVKELTGDQVPVAEASKEGKQIVMVGAND